MAHTFKLQKLLPCNPLLLGGCKLFRTYAHNARQKNSYSTVHELDTVDVFTTKLIQSKLTKWDIIARQKLAKDKVSLPKQHNNTAECNLHVNELNVKELDKVLKDAVESYNNSLVKYIINKCVEYNKLPSNVVLLQVLSILSAEGEKDAILCITNLCAKLDPSILKANADFCHYIAEVMWLRGNMSEAITVFENVYRNNVYLRRKISSILKSLLSTVPNHSEAILVMLIGYAERIATDFNDYIFLTHLWKLCFLSEWYSDQCLAFDLLKRHKDLCSLISKYLTPIVGIALKKEQSDVVYKLLEVLLMMKCKSEYAQVLEVLFDYRVHRGDLRSCSEIMQWALDQDIDLPVLQQQMFVDLLLSYKDYECIINTLRKRPVSDNSLSYKF